MRAWNLPSSPEIDGTEYPIETDFRTILNILSYFSNPDYEEDEKWMICMEFLFGDVFAIPPSSYQEAMRKITDFIDMGMEGDERQKPRTMDWEQDAGLIIPAVNRVMGCEVRSLDYLHWWTFLGAYMEIGESLFSTVLQIRTKKAKGKKLEKEEKEFLRENRKLVELENRYSQSELNEQERLKAMLG